MAWYINGDYIIACSCDYGCPCNFNARPTQGFCAGCSLLRINDGKHDGVPLNGLYCGFASRWDGEIHEGNGVVSYYIDANTGAAEQNALAQIITGKAGGPLFPALAATYSRTSGPHLVDIQITGPRENTVADVRDLKALHRVHMSFKPIVDPRTARPAFPTVFLRRGFSYQEGGDQYALEDFWVKDEFDELNFGHQNTSAQFEKVHWEAP